jgi:hypothetical protein
LFRFRAEVAHISPSGGHFLKFICVMDQRWAG